MLIDDIVSLLPDDSVIESMRESNPTAHIMTRQESSEYILAHTPRNIGNILAFLHRDTESFMYEGIPAGEIHGEYFNVKLKNNFTGYALTTMLNMDIQSVSDTISKLEECDDGELPEDPEFIYNQLVSLNDVFKFYLPTEWRKMARDFWPENGVFYTISTLRKYIIFCNEKKIPYNGQFFTFLLSNGYFGIAHISMLMPAKEFVTYDSIFDYDGRSSHDLSEIYDIFNNGAKLNPEISYDYIIMPEERLQAIAMISFNELATRGKSICKCHNCGKYFVPSRSDALYCDNPSPKEPEMTCKEYGRQRLWYERQKQNELATLARNVASAKCMLVKRHPDIADYAASYEYFKDNLRIWKKDVRDGVKEPDEFREWLLSMQSKKTIHYAITQEGNEDG